MLGHASAQASGQVAQTVYSRNALANLERLYICLAGNNPDAALRAIRVTRDKIAILPKAVAPVPLGLAAVVTLGLLAGVHGMAAQDNGALAWAHAAQLATKQASKQAAQQAAAAPAVRASKA